MPDGFIVTFIKALVLANLVMLVFAFLTWLERRLLGRFQVRLGPNRVGPFGLLQPIADLVKLIRKESLLPEGISPLLYIAAPVISLFASLAVFAVIPFGEQATIPGTDYQIYLWISDPSVALLVVFALGSLELLRLPDRGLVVELQVQPVRVDAGRQPADLVRGQPGARRDRGRDDGAVAVAHRHRRGSEPRRPLVRRSRSSSASSSTSSRRPPR